MGSRARMKRKRPSRTGGRSPLAVDAIAARDVFTFGGHRLHSLYRPFTLPRTG
jgi:hypothetical protein